MGSIVAIGSRGKLTQQRTIATQGEDYPRQRLPKAQAAPGKRHAPWPTH
jgi:hypothetical protein